MEEKEEESDAFRCRVWQSDSAILLKSTAVVIVCVHSFIGERAFWNDSREENVISQVLVTFWIATNYELAIIEYFSNRPGFQIFTHSLLQIWQWTTSILQL